MITARWLLLVIGAVVCGSLGWTLRDNAPTLADQDRDRQREFEVDRARAWQDRYEAADRDTVFIIREKAVADSIGAILSAYRDSLPRLYSTGDSLRVAMRGWMLAEIRGDRLQSALNKATVWGRIGWGLADSAAPVIQGLQDALERETKARRCRIIGILSCPSRKTAAIAAAGGGLVLGLLLSR